SGLPSLPSGFPSSETVIEPSPCSIRRMLFLSSTIGESPPDSTSTTTSAGSGAADCGGTRRRLPARPDKETLLVEVSWLPELEGTQGAKRLRRAAHAFYLTRGSIIATWPGE